MEKKQEPTVAPGSDLDKEATEEEISAGEYTTVSRMEYDEYDPARVDDEH